MWTDTHNLNGVHMARMDKKEKVRGIIHPNVGHAADLITFDLRNQPDISSNYPQTFPNGYYPQTFSNRNYPQTFSNRNCPQTFPNHFTNIP